MRQTGEASPSSVAFMQVSVQVIESFPGNGSPFKSASPGILLTFVLERENGGADHDPAFDSEGQGEKAAPEGM